MASKTINIDSKLYTRLKDLKKNRSFTEFITYLLENASTPPIDFFGVLENEEISYEEIKRSRIDRDIDF